MRWRFVWYNDSTFKEAKFAEKKKTIRWIEIFLNEDIAERQLVVHSFKTWERE